MVNFNQVSLAEQTSNIPVEEFTQSLGSSALELFEEVTVAAETTAAFDAAIVA